MRILIVSQFFTPEPCLKGLEFARALSERGHQVQVLTGFPNFPIGKLYSGYQQKFFQREKLDGVSVVRVPLYPSHDNSMVRRAWNYGSFALSASILGSLLIDSADVLYAYHPPATIALPAFLLAKVRRIPVVYDIQDLWPDTLRATQVVRNSTILALVGRWCQMVYRHSDKVVVLSPGFKEQLIQRGVPSGKIEVVYNWTLDRVIARKERNDALARELGMADKFNVLFAGTMGKAQGLETVIQAAERLQHRSPHVQIVMVGDGVECDNLKRMTQEKKLSNVVFHPWRPVSEIGDVLSLADVLLVHLRKDPLFRITIPSKIQTYLSVGKPILAGVEGDAANLVLRAHAGFTYDSGAPEALAQLIEQMAGMPRAALEEMGERGRQFYQNELSLSSGVDRFEKVFLEVVEKQRSDVRGRKSSG